MAVMSGAGAPAHAVPAKPESKRHGYDFTRPDPREVLPNPTEALGVPPHLRAYVAAKEMLSHVTADEVRGKASVPIGGPPAPALAVVKPAAPPLTFGTQAHGSAGAENAANKLSLSALAAQYVQKILAKELLVKGLGGAYVYQPSRAAKTDANMKVFEERSWNNMVASLDESWREWQTTHADDEIPEPGETVADEAASSPAPILTGKSPPGLILLEGAPASVTGDLVDPKP
jgi:hypothetical protein